MTEKVPYIIGEVLFDCFEDGERVLGGAPFNVAWHLAGFSVDPLFLSAVGRDEPGEEILSRMRQRGLSTAGVQQRAEVPTGRVDVRDAAGEPSYDFPERSAWDAFALDECDRVGEPSILYQGSLFLRQAVSRASSMRLAREVACPRFVDINLRPPWYEPEHILALVRGVHCLKVSEDELALLARWVEVDASAARAEMAPRVREAIGAEHLFVTRGADGAAWYTADGRALRAAAHRVEHFADSVGAGDASAAVALLGLVRGWPIPLLLERAMFFASRVCSIPGAIPTDQGFYNDVSKKWNHE